MPCFARILEIVLFPACFAPCSRTSSAASLPTVFAVCLRAVLTVFSAASSPKALATPVPAAPPNPFEIGANRPFMEPVTES